MGMFNTLICEYPLPDGFVSRDNFQTKSLYPNICDLYKLDAEGMLHRVGVGSAEDYHFPLEEYSGEVVFYTSDVHPDEDINDNGIDWDARWHEYRACFVRGRLARLEAVTEDTWLSPKAGHKAKFAGSREMFRPWERDYD